MRRGRIGERMGKKSVKHVQRYRLVPAEKSKALSLCGPARFIWPGIFQRAERCKLKGSLWLIVGLLLINTFSSRFQAPRLAENQN